MSVEKRSRWGSNGFLAHLESRLDPVPGFEQVALLQVNLDGTVQDMHSLLSVPVDLYSLAQCLFPCRGELPR